MHYFSQFNAMCAYLWHFRRDEYVWYAHSAIKIDLSAIQTTSIFNASMQQPKPRVAIHTNYHTGDLKSVIQEGFCRSCPFPKQDELLERHCSQYNLSHFFKAMHSFEFGDFWAVETESRLNRQNSLRLERFKDCNFNHTFALDVLTELRRVGDLG